MNGALEGMWPAGVQVWEHAPNDEADRWIVYLGEAVWTMSDDADRANGVCMYAGTAGDLFRPKIEGRPVVLGDLPKGVLVAIVGILAEAAP